MHPRLAPYIDFVEDAVLGLIAVVLVVLAVALLATGVMEMVDGIMAGHIAEHGIEILNGIILVMMIMEIVHTVTMSIEEHVVTAEPFLVIGAIAAIRRMLVITAQGTGLEANPEAFRSLLLELALLAMIVFIVVALSIFILRRAGSGVRSSQAAKAQDEPAASTVSGAGAILPSCSSGATPLPAQPEAHRRRCRRCRPGRTPG